MAGVMTMVSARIDPDRAGEVTSAFSRAVRAGLPERRQTFLLKGDGDLWRIVTAWRSREDLDRYLASVEEPLALRIFRTVGASAEVEVLEVVLDSSAPWWP